MVRREYCLTGNSNIKIEGNKPKWQQAKFRKKLRTKGVIQNSFG